MVDCFFFYQQFSKCIGWPKATGKGYEDHYEHCLKTKTERSTEISINRISCSTSMSEYHITSSRSHSVSVKIYLLWETIRCRNLSVMETFLPRKLATCHAWDEHKTDTADVSEWNLGAQLDTVYYTYVTVGLCEEERICWSCIFHSTFARLSRKMRSVNGRLTMELY